MSRGQTPCLVMRVSSLRNFGWTSFKYNFDHLPQHPSLDYSLIYLVSEPKSKELKLEIPPP